MAESKKPAFDQSADDIFDTLAQVTAELNKLESTIESMIRFKPNDADLKLAKAALQPASTSAAATSTTSASFTQGFFSTDAEGATNNGEGDKPAPTTPGMSSS